MGDSLAARLLDLLAEAGVTTAFGLPGVHNLAFWREQGDGRPRIVGVRHEQATVYAADGLARATGRLGIALVTTGPGAANAVGAFGEAAASRSPVLLLATEIPTTLARPGAVRGVLHESRDQAAMFAPLAKAVFTPRTPADVVAAMTAAINTATTSPRGPVYLDIPTDLLSGPAPAPAPAAPAGHGAGIGPAADVSAADVDRLLAEVRSAGRIVLWAGGGVIEAGASAAVGRLAEHLHAPVVTSWAARGVLPPEHPWLVGYPPHEPAVADLIATADLLLALGTRFDATTTRNWSMPRGRRLAVVNLDPEALALNYRPDAAVRGDVGAVVAELMRWTGGRADSNPVPELRRSVRAGLVADARHAEPLRLLAAVEAAITPDTVVLADMALPGYWWIGYGSVHGPRRVQYPMGWGTLGYAVPAAIGVAGHRPALVLCGDGGLAMGVGELATYVQEKLPITVLVVDDGGYGMLRYDQIRLGDEHRGVDRFNPDWALLGAAFGIETDVLDGIDDRLAPALRAAVASGQPRLVVVRASFVPPRTTSPRWAD